MEYVDFNQVLIHILFNEGEAKREDWTESICLINKKYPNPNIGWKERKQAYCLFKCDMLAKDWILL